VPPTTAVRIADAALEVLGTGGIHALSHARVDATAGLPAGSTSNYCRTRASLMAAAVARLRELDAADFQSQLDLGYPTSPDELAGLLAAFVEGSTGPMRQRTVARYVIFVQGVVEPDLLAMLNADRQRVVDWLASALRNLTMPDAVAPTLLAACEGLILHRLTGFVIDPPGPEITRLVLSLAGHPNAA
jgi:DNA-binding transcriptional regulator YbjK